jgi:ABC-2 type transport system permease protein
VGAMRNLWVVAWNDLQMTFQNKRSWFYLLAVPALVIYLAGLGAQGVARIVMPSIRIDVLDRDRSAASRALVTALAEANEALILCPADDDPADACGLAGASLSPQLAQERLANEVTFAIITIPEGFAAALEQGREVTLDFQSGAASAASEIAFRALQNATSEMDGPFIAARLSTQLAESLDIETGPEFYAARLAAAVASWGPPPPVQVTTELTQPNEPLIVEAQLLENGFKLSTPSITAMFVMISILGMTQSLAEERWMGILRRLGMMPVSKAQWLGGKLLSTCLLGLVQFAALLAFGRLLGVDFGSAPLATMLLASAYVLAVTAMALALVALTHTANQASAMATIAWAVLVPLGGGWWPLIFAPRGMQKLGHVSPVAWCLDGLNALVFYQGTFADVLQPVAALLVFAGVFLVFGVKQLDYHRSGGDDAIQSLPYFGIQRSG